MRNKIDLLVLPGLFPEYEGDIKGIFVLDYLESVRDSCNINVFVFQFLGKKKGLNIEKHNEATIYRYVFSNKKKISKIRKYFIYLRWFSLGKKIILKHIKNIQIIHAHGSVLYGNLARIISKRTKIPYIITEHTNPFSKISKKTISKLLAKNSMEVSNAVLCVSNHLHNEVIEAKIMPRKVIITYNPVNTSIFRSKEINKNLLKNYFIFVGNLNERKGALRALIAFKNIYKKHPKWDLIIIGDGEKREDIQSLIDSNKGLKNRVIFKKTQPKEEIVNLFNISSFLLFPTISESFGLVIAEAMACGLPVIVGNKTAPLEYVDEESGLFVDPFNIDDIANAIEFMINNYTKFDPELIRKKIVDRFSFKVFGDKLVNIYRELL